MLRPHKPGRVLAFATDGGLLYGAVVTTTLAGAHHLGQVAVSRAVEPEEAVAEILEALQQEAEPEQQGPAWKQALNKVTPAGGLPKKAVLSTPSAISALLRLPVDPAQKKLHGQMQEMVRWEMEELFMDSSSLWSLGALLTARGALAPEMRGELESAALAEGRRPNADLFQDHVGREELDVCSRLQELWANVDDDLLTGWVPGGAEQNDEGFAWFCSGISEGAAGQWVEAMAKNRIYLDHIYPQLAAPLPLVPETEAPRLLLDCRREQFALVRFQRQALEGYQVRSCSLGRIDVSQVQELLVPPITDKVEQLFINPDTDAPDDLLSLIHEAAAGKGLEVKTLSPVSGELETSAQPAVAASLLGMALHHLGTVKPGLASPVRAQKPKPPVWKNRELYPALVIVLVLAGVAWNESHMRNQARKNDWDLQLMDIEYDKNRKIIQEANQTKQEAKKLEQVLTAKEVELAELHHLADILDSIIRYRQDLIPGILRSIGAAVSDLVLLDRLEEDENRKGFYMEGWSLTDTEAQRFATKLNQELAPWRYKVADIKLAKGKNRLDLEGYVVKIWLAVMQEAEVAKDAS